MNRDLRRELHIIVPGKPTGKGRPRFTSKGGQPRTYTPEKTANYENYVKVMALQALKNVKDWRRSGQFEVAIVAEQIRLDQPKAFKKWPEATE